MSCLGLTVRNWTESKTTCLLSITSMCVCVNVTQSCPTLGDPMDYIVHGILQARILEWVVFPFSRGSSQARDRIQVSHIAGGFFISWATREALFKPYIRHTYLARSNLVQSWKGVSLLWVRIKQAAITKLEKKGEWKDINLCWETY